MSDPAPPRPSLLTEARLGVRGVFALLGFRPHWRAYFNPSRAGAIRSFAGALLALPAFWFMVEAANFYLAENPAAEADPVGALESVLLWARQWLLFPLIAWGVCALMGLTDRLAAWISVHNWTIFVLIHIQALFWALYMAGLADPSSLALFLVLFQAARLFVHWRVAQGALGLPPGLAAAAAGVPLITEMVIAQALS